MMPLFTHKMYVITIVDHHDIALYHERRGEWKEAFNDYKQYDAFFFLPVLSLFL